MAAKNNDGDTAQTLGKVEAIKFNRLTIEVVAPPNERARHEKRNPLQSPHVRPG
ncbi:hypothetical protein RE6C_00841 [Rhodopirellula europaea 6C]|uniref:Uncharacterized protein n=1 Tax=Rhodopirellula europaea 6C TaxID=1263867 RepID=M2AMQ1_9BACT|nr:hypothetical protein RE6C_00841 [Rhodopirellula europaea 6C]